MNALRGLVGLLILTGTLRAQQLDNPETIPISFYGEGYSGGSTGSFSFGVEIGAVATASGNVAPFYSNVVTGSMIPRKEYDVMVTMNGLGATICHFLDVPDHDILINGYKGSMTGNGGSFSFKIRLEPRINDFTSGLAGTRGGQCSRLAEDKPFWYVGLGAMRSGRFAGGVGFRSATLSSALFNTSSLIYDSIDMSEVDGVRPSWNSKYLRQILAREVLVDIDNYNAGGTSYNLRIYTRDSVNLVPGKINEVWTLNGGAVPFITYTVRQYGNGVQIIKYEGGAYWATALQQNGSEWTFWDWRECYSNGSFVDDSKRVVTSVSGSTRTMYYGGATATSSPVVKRTKTYLGWGGELSAITLGSGEAYAPVTTYSYYTASTGTGWERQVQWMIEPTGKWTKYDYYNGTDSRAGLIQRIYRPWLDSPGSPGSATTTNCQVETYNYTANFDGSTTAPSSKIVTVNNTTVAQTTWSYNFNYATVNGHTITQTIQTDYLAGSSLSGTTLAYRLNDDTYFQGKPHAVMRPDGTKDSYAYYAGTWSGSSFTPGAGDDKLILCLHGQSGSAGGTWVTSWSVAGTPWSVDGLYLIANFSTVSETVIDTRGRVVLKADNIYTGGSSMERISGTAYAYTANNQLDYEKDIIRSVPGADVLVDYAYRADGLLDSKTDIDGTRTTYGYDTFLRNTTITTAATGSGSYPAKTQTFTYNLGDLKQTSQDCSCSPTITTYYYETTGRIDWMTEPKPGAVGVSLTTNYTYDSATRMRVTLPTGAELITDLYLDGRTKDTIGSGQVATYFDYSVGSYTMTKTTRNGSGSAYPWSSEIVDGLGRVIQRRTPQYGWTTSLNNKVVRKTNNYSSTSGQLTSTTTTDEAAGFARLLPDHLYIYGNLGMLVQEGDDLGSNGFLDTGTTDRITLYSSSFYKDTGGYNGWVRQDLTQVYRTLNNASDITTTSDRRTRYTRFNNGAASGNSRAIADVLAFDASGRWSVSWEWVNPVARTRQRTMQFQGTGQGATNWQDGYLASETTTSGSTKTYTYNGQGLQASVTENGTGDVTSYAYHPGTKYLASLARNTGNGTTATTSYAYYWSNTDPSATSYRTVRATDAANKVTYTEYDAMDLLWHTWGSGAQPTLTTNDAYGRRGSLTTWQTGTFTGSTWPSLGGSATTTWNYDTATGLVNNKVYPGGATVGYTYNPRGQMATRTWARGVVTTNAYFPLTGELQQTSYSDGTPTLTYSYNRFGAPATVDQAGVTNRSFAYRSDLKPDYESFDAFYGWRTLTSTYDASVPGRMTGYSFNGNVTVATTLGYNGAGQVSSVQGTLSPASVTFALGYASGTDWVQTVSSGSYSRTNYLAYQRNVVDQVLTQWAGSTRGDFNSGFDSLGRRSDLYCGGSVAFGNNQHHFGYNFRSELNNEWNDQNYLRDAYYEYDLMGNRVQHEEESYSWTTSYTDDATNKYTSITGQWPEPDINHDADGNLTIDGTWTYTWDGENRLKTMSRRDSSQSLTFTYDYAGRRIRKQVSGTGATDRKYVWNGWKLAAETSGDGYSVYFSFIWGPDFSNAQGSAGGAGGLLAIYSPGWALHYAVPDALGNVAGYLDVSGNVEAAWEYNAFGRIRQHSGWAQELPIGYASQYTDRETDDVSGNGSALVYYGLRFYDPEHGRFLNRDPIGEAGGNNLYNFVGNNPVNRWDVLGLCGGFYEPPCFAIGDLIIDYPGSDWAMIWIYSYPGDTRFRPHTSGTFTQPNISFNEGWQRDWRKADAIYRAQGAGRSGFRNMTYGLVQDKFRDLGAHTVTAVDMGQVLAGRKVLTLTGGLTQFEKLAGKQGRREVEGAPGVWRIELSELEAHGFYTYYSGKEKKHELHHRDIWLRNLNDFERTVEDLRGTRAQIDCYYSLIGEMQDVFISRAEAQNDAWDCNEYNLYCDAATKKREETNRLTDELNAKLRECAKK